MTRDQYLAGLATLEQDRISLRYLETSFHYEAALAGYPRPGIVTHVRLFLRSVHVWLCPWILSRPHPYL